MAVKPEEVKAEIDAQTIPADMSVRGFLVQQLDKHTGQGKRFTTKEMREQVIRAVAKQFKENAESLISLDHAKGKGHVLTEREITLLVGILGFGDPSLSLLIPRAEVEYAQANEKAGHWGFFNAGNAALVEVLEFANGLADRLREEHKAGIVYSTKSETSKQPASMSAEALAILKAKIDARKAAEKNGGKTDPLPPKEPETNGRKNSKSIKANSVQNGAKLDEKKLPSAKRPRSDKNRGQS